MSGNVQINGRFFSILVSLLIGAVLAIWIGHDQTDENRQQAHVTKTIHYRFQVSNPGNQPVSDAYLLVRAPLEETGVQRCLSVDASHPYEAITDSKGNPLLKFSFDTFPPYASKIVSVRANLVLADGPVSRAANPPADDWERLAVESAVGDELRQLTEPLRAESVHATAEKIYRWVIGNLSYSGYSGRAKGVRHALSTRQGDCTEFADLFVAMARTVNIPARRVSGFFAGDTSVLTPVDHHDWAEFYDNGIWRIADPQQRNFDARYSDYVAMQVCDLSPSGTQLKSFHRFYVHGNGLKGKMDS